MPAFTMQRQPLAQATADTVAVFAAARDDVAVAGADAVEAARLLDVDLNATLAAVGFTGELGAVARIPTRGAFGATLLLVVGLGDSDKADIDALRKAAGASARNATKDSTLAVVVPADLLPGASGAAERAQAVVEGAGLGAYAFTTYRTKHPDMPSIDAVQILPGAGLDADEAERGLDVGALLVRATSLTRDIVNTPPGDKRPPALAEQVADLAAQAGLDVEVLDEHALAEGGFGGILGVGQGSSQAPRLVRLTHEPRAAAGHVVLVGKGITFDSGGLSLKPSDAMATMKCDLSGAAAIVGAMSVLAELQVGLKVTGLLALAENMPSGQAIRVSDVLRHRGGKTVEVMNTDAEGRLVLADALAYGAELRPDAMVDIATLTGAQVVALGNQIAGLMGTDDGLVGELQQAARATGEQVWHLPLPPEYADHLRSPVADLKNIGKPMQAGTLVAGLYLKEFTADIAWAHLDIAGPAFSEDGDGFYTAKGGTGMGVRLLVEFLRARAVRTEPGAR